MNFSFSAIMRFTIVVLSDMSLQLLGLDNCHEIWYTLSCPLQGEL